MHGTSHCNLHNHFPQCPRGRLPWGRNVELRFEKKRLLPPGASPLGTVASGLSLKFGSPFGLRTCSAPAACLPAFLPDFPPAPPSPVGVQARGLAQRMRTAGVRPTGVVRGCLGRKRTISVGKKKKKNTETIDTGHHFLLAFLFFWPRKPVVETIPRLPQTAATSPHEKQQPTGQSCQKNVSHLTQLKLPSTEEN